MPRLRTFSAGFAAGAFTVSAYSARRGIAREWHWAKRDLRDLRAELVRYLERR